MVISNLALSVVNVTASQTLLLTNATLLNAPLKIASTLTIGAHTSVIVSNAALQIGGANAGTLSDNGGLTMFGGTLMGTNVGTTFIVGDTGVGAMTVLSGTSQVYNVTIGNNPGSQGTLSIAGGSNVLSSVEIAVASNSVGAVWLTGGQLSANVHTLVGLYGTGQLTISNGTWNSYDATVGQFDRAQGTLTVAGGTITITPQYLIIGNTANATGAVWVTGGLLNVPFDPTYIGEGGVGQMTVSNGTWLSGDGTYVGLQTGSQGTLTIAGGTNSVSFHFEVGYNAGATGAVWMTGGQLTVTNNVTTTIGDQGMGQMTVSNGTWLASKVIVALTNGSQGTLTIAGGSATFLTNNILTTALIVGQLPGATGAVWLTGGQLTTSNNPVSIGDSQGVGQMTVSNGTWRAGTIYAGNNFGSVGTLTLAGGTVTVAAGPTYFIVGGGFPSTGTVWVTGGQLVVTNSQTVISDNGVGQMIVSNGTWLARDVLVSVNPTSVGTLTVVGGTSLISSNMILGYFGCADPPGFVNVTGGELRVTNDTGSAVLDVRSGTVTQSGGVLDIDRLVITNACAHFIHTGGTLITGLITLDPALDADGDGLPNGYEQAHGLDPFNPLGNQGADGDLDGDGMSNLDEMLAGTNPNDPDSVFRITAVARQGNDMLINWTTVSNMTYRVLVCAGNPQGGYTNNFSNLSPFITATTAGESTTNYLDVGGATNAVARYYRVKVFP